MPPHSLLPQVQILSPFPRPNLGGSPPPPAPRWSSLNVLNGHSATAKSNTKFTGSLQNQVHDWPGHGHCSCFLIRYWAGQFKDMLHILPQPKSVKPALCMCHLYRNLIKCIFYCFSDQGAALATLTAYYLARHWPGIQLTVYTFGSPRGVRYYYIFSQSTVTFYMFYNFSQSTVGFHLKLALSV